VEDISLKPIPVLCVTTHKGSEDIQRVWNELESKIPSLKGRKFYGTFQPPDGPYRACVALQPGESADLMQLESWTIPGGRYARRKLLDWEEHRDEIGGMFEEMADHEPADPARPSIEFYRSQRELVLLLPVNTTQR
jgi:hypothetical protein